MSLPLRLIMVLPSLLLILSATRLIGLLLRASTSTAQSVTISFTTRARWASTRGQQPSSFLSPCALRGAQERYVCHSSPFRLYKFSESCTIAEIFLASFPSSFILHLPVSSAERPSQFTELKGGCMAILPSTTRPSCVLGTPACPRCKDTALVANGGFLTCPTCGLAITRQALLQEVLNLCLVTEPQ